MVARSYGENLMTIGQTVFKILRFFEIYNLAGISASAGVLGAFLGDITPLWWSEMIQTYKRHFLAPNHAF